MNTTRTEREAAVGMLKAVASAIKDLGRVPSGELYARLMGYVTLDQYDLLIGVLVRSRLVRQENHELIWVA